MISGRGKRKAFRAAFGLSVVLFAAVVAVAVWRARRRSGFLETNAVVDSKEWTPLSGRIVADPSAYRPPRIENALEIAQPEGIPAGWNMQVHGLAYDRPISGDVAVEAKIDLEASRTWPTPPGEAVTVSLWLSVDPANTVIASYLPDGDPVPILKVECGKESRGGAVLRFPRTLSLALERRGSEMVSRIRMNDGPTTECAMRVDATAPARDAGLGVYLFRSHGPVDTEFQSGRRNSYTVRELRVRCVDSHGCN